MSFRIPKPPRRGPAPIGAHRLDLARRFLADCEKVYDESPGDFSSTENVVETYTKRSGQLKYAHMYFAKSVACWRFLRRRLHVPDDGPVWSLGAGPCMCLIGWFLDAPPEDGQHVVAVDALRWKFIHELASHGALMEDVLGRDAEIEVLDRHYFPGGHPPQLASRGDLAPLDPDDVPEGATVLLPFVLNHMVGWNQPLRRPASLWRWLNEVRARAARIIIADMQWDPERGTDGFWNSVADGLGVAGTPRALTFEPDIRMFADAYSPREYWPNRRTSVHMSQVTAICGDGSGWRYV